MQSRIVEENDNATDMTRTVRALGAVMQSVREMKLPSVEQRAKFNVSAMVTELLGQLCRLCLMPAEQYRALRKPAMNTICVLLEQVEQKELPIVPLWTVALLFLSMSQDEVKDGVATDSLSTMATFIVGSLCRL